MGAILEDTESDGTISASELEDGQLAVITRTTVGNYAGRIVQVYGNHLVSVGCKECDGWTPLPTYGVFRVRVLEAGELIQVT